jgi:heme exporter protein A
MMSLVGRQLTCVRGERTVFAGLSFEVGRGDALLLRGPNGAGKSSLLRIVATLLRPAAGELTWDGTDILDDPEAHRQRLSYQGHQDAIKAALTVGENLTHWAQILGGDAARIPSALETLGIAHLADAPVQHLSAGQRRRAGLARLAIANTPLWLLDEPTVSLDDDGVAALAALVSAHRARGGMVMAATHIDLGFENARSLRLGPA